jgi:putative restriction endonuclease
VKTSDHLQGGSIYTRDELKEKFSIQAASINNGIFRPRGHDSIWLFVTKKKTPDRTQYDDDLRGDELHMDGQSAGRTDQMLIEHESRGLEVILLYRESKLEHPGGGFRYEGCFRYVDHRGTRPAQFHFRRVI